MNMNLSLVKSSVEQSYGTLNSLPSMYLSSLDDRARNVIIDVMMQLRIARDELAKDAPVVTDCGYSSTTMCRHWKHSPEGQEFKAMLDAVPSMPQSRR